MNAFPKLFEPIKISGLFLLNRIVKAPLCTNYATPDGFVTPEMIAYYREQAHGGTGLVIVEFAYIDNDASKSWPRQLGAENDGKLEGLRGLADAIRSEGVAAALQICHCGAQRLIPGGPPRVPSASAVSGDREVREVGQRELELIIESYADAALRAKRAGFDMVEIHGAHGYLLAGFMSPETNRRTDAFGGNLKGRLRLPRLVIEAIRRAVGEGFPVCIRMNGSEMFRGGMSLKDGLEAARTFVQAGADLIHVSGGTYGTRHLRSTPMYARRGNLVPLATAIRRVSSVPVIASGGLSDPAHLETIIREGRADMVSLGRQLHAEPHWARKVREGRLEDLRPCIRCNAGCLGNGLQGDRVICDVNPETGFEAARRLVPARKTKRVVVVGGGPAGMEAARVLSLRGHEVVLIEGQNRLGGALIPATRPKFKGDLRAFLAYLERQLRNAPVEIRLNSVVRREDLAGLEADEIVLATGAIPKRPSEMRGCVGPNTLPATEALLNEGRVGQRVVVVGSGIAGSETAWHLALLGRSVTLLEAGNMLAPDMEGMHRPHFTKGIEKAGVQWQTGAKVTSIAEDGTVTYELNGASQRASADTVVLAVGVQPETCLSGASSGLNVPVHRIGDCATPGRLFGAMHDGARVGREI